jgi:hypothetical protein
MNNPSISGWELSEVLNLDTNVQYFVFQREKAPETGTIHYQGYIEFKNARELDTVRKFFSGSLQAHVEVRNGSQKQAISYCTKKSSRTDGPWSGGEMKNQGNRTDLLAANEVLTKTLSLKSVYQAFPSQFIRYSRGFEKALSLNIKNKRDPPKVILYYGTTGTGKTRTAFERYSGDGEDDVYIKMPDTRWYDGYTTQKTLILDDFSGKSSKVSLNYTLQLLDRYPFQVEYKGGYRPLIAKNIIITSNIHPYLWYDYSSRQEQYKALARRIHAVFYFPPEATNDSSKIRLVTKQSFFNDWAEHCDESTVFKDAINKDLDLKPHVKRTKSFIDLTCNEDLDITPMKKRKVSFSQSTPDFFEYYAKILLEDTGMTPKKEVYCVDCGSIKCDCDSEDSIQTVFTDDSEILETTVEYESDDSNVDSDY